MSILPILTYPDDHLRKVADPVTKVDGDVRQLLDDMAETMYHEPGIGLAATQVGSLARAIVVDVGDEEDYDQVGKLYQIVNPELVFQEGQTRTEEGCLSLPGVREYVKRSAHVVVRGLDREGAPMELDAKGLLAICLQHEIDHLNGVLLIDHVSRLKRGLAIKELKKRKQNL